MDKTIRNLDERAYRALKARAASQGRSLGEVVSEAIRSYLGRPRPGSGTASLADLIPEDLGPGTETLSDDVDTIVYGG
jgi:plasmid stability protein